MRPRQLWAVPAWLVVVLAALIAIAPLLIHGCSCGHDFDFHLVSWLEAANQFRHGNLHPQWAVSPGYNAGEPRFVFYPPLSWYLGASLGLLLTHLPGVSEAAGWSATPIVFTWCALALAGWSMYRLAREFADVPGAIIAAVFYLANPYMLFTALERTAFAELLAAAWMPLLLQAILRERITIPRIAIPLALLWLTNAPAAVIGSYTLALLAVVRVAGSMSGMGPGLRWIARLRGSIKLITGIVAGTALGLMVAGFYLVPAAYERRYVLIQMAIIPRLRIEDNYLFHHFIGPDSVLHDQVLRTASFIALGLALFCLLVLAFWWIASRRQERRPASLSVVALAILASVVLFVLTPWSGFFWRHAPEVQFLQFPWRATSVLAVIAALACAGLLSSRWPQKHAPLASIAAIVIAIPLAWTASSAFRQGCGPQNTPDAHLAVFNSTQGSEPTDEYTPIDADNDVLRTNDPPYWLAAQPNDPPPANTSMLAGPAPEHLELRSPRAADLVLNLRAYPAWQVLLDGAPDLQRVQRDDGLLTLPIPPGASTVDLHWIRTPDQKVGDVTTLLGLGLLTASMLPARWRLRRRS